MVFFSDCGLFVLSFAEYFVDTKPIPSELDVELHRDRLAVSLYKYARMKEIDLRDSSDEAPPKKSKKYFFFCFLCFVVCFYVFCLLYLLF